MAYLKHNDDHTVSKLRKTMSEGKGLQVFNRLMRDEKAKKQLLKDMGVPLADVDAIKRHVAEETNKLGGQLKSKKQILQHFRGKWGLNVTNSKKLLEAIAPDDQGPSKEDLAKIKQRNIRMKFIADVIGSNRVSARSGQTAADKRAAIAEEKKKDMLMSHTPGYQKGMAKKPAGNNLVAGPWGGQAKDLTMDGELKVKLIEEDEKFAGGKPKRGVASVANLDEARKKKLQQKAENDSEHHDDASHKIPMASGL